MSEEAAVTEDEIMSRLPEPRGYKILIALPKIAEAYASGILKSEQEVKREEASTVIGHVLEMGAEAYQDKVKFPNGPWCRINDHVLIRAYSGTRFKVFGREFRLINDDTVEAVVADPTGISRI